MIQIPAFGYPGSKAKLARTILSLMPHEGHRFVDVFAGRGNVTWAVMVLLKYRRYWINAVGTYDFFDGLRHSSLYAVPPRNGKESYRRMKMRMKMGKNGEIRRHRVEVLPLDLIVGDDPSWGRIQSLPKNVAVSVKHGDVRITRPDNARPESVAQPAPLLESYLTFGGGDYSKGGQRGDRRGGVSRATYGRHIDYARTLMLEHRPRLTAWDYTRVFAELGPSDLAYCDPPYAGYDMGTYSDQSLDHRDLVQLLLRARFKWILSEYEHPIYRPLGEPVIRKEVPRYMANSRQTDGPRKKAVECLWTNFDPPYLTECLLMERMERMPKIEVADLITDLQRQRDEIDATIRVLSRTLSRSNAPDTKAKSKSLRTRSAGEQGEAMGAAESRRPKRPLSPASRKKLSEAAKKRWAIAKSAAKS